MPFYSFLSEILKIVNLYIKYHSVECSIRFIFFKFPFSGSMPAVLITLAIAVK